MSDVPALIDRAALHAARKKAVRLGGGPAFLRARAAEDVADRLAATLRSLPLALDLGSPGDEIAAAISGHPRIERVLRAAPLARAGVDVACEPDLPCFADESVDLVVSCLALHLVDDLPGALAQIRRMLRPDGLLLAALPGGETLTELRTAFAEAETELLGGASPRILPFADARAMGGLLQRAGLALPVTDVDRVTVRYDDMFSLIADLRGWGATNVLAQRRRTPLRRDVLVRAAQVYAERFSDPDGRVRATFEIVWMSGWAPHPDQQKPLAPGSAKARLADALGVREGKLGRDG